MDENRPLPRFRCEDIEKSKLHREWTNWKSALERYFEANDVVDQYRKRAKLLYLGGPQLDNVFKNLPDGERFPLVAIERRYYDVAVAALDNYFQPVKQDILERHRLRQMKQLAGEKFSHYLVRLRQQAALCGFDKFPRETCKVLTDLMLIDIVVEGCQSMELRKRLLSKDRTLEEIEEIANSLEGVDAQIQDLMNKTCEPSEKVYKLKAKPAHLAKRSIVYPHTRPYDFNNSRSASTVCCFNCGRTGHISSSVHCPAKGKQCNVCKRFGHFEAKCKFRDRGPTTSKQPSPGSSKQIRALEEAPVTSGSTEVTTEEKVYYAFFSGNRSNELLFDVGGISLEMIVDSGADANMIPTECWERLKQRGVRIQSSTKVVNRTFVGYGSNVPLVIRGRFSAEIRVGSKSTVAEFFVVDNGQKCLMGDSTAKELDVLRIGTNLNRIQETQPFAAISDVEVQIHMDASVKPVVQPLRRLPVPIEAEVNRKLDDLLRHDIIEPKLGPTSWVSPLVVVAKTNGGIRLCVDLRRVNQAVLRERHPMPVIEQIIARIGNSTVFSKLDIKDSFLQVTVAPESRDILTFITDKGLFRFKRLPFGLITAPEIFQRVIDSILCGCEGVYWYLDDILVVGKSAEEHDARLKEVLKRLDERNVQLNKEKCSFGVKEIEFLGHRISSRGLAPSTTKVDAVLKFRRPENEGEVRSFLGLANYLNKYIPNLAVLDEPLRQLTKKENRFVWGDAEEQAFISIKKAMSDTKMLGLFKVEDRTSVIADASPVGLGAILIQTDRQGNSRVISYASKALTETEKRYCQTEKEALALVWSVEKFQYFLIGRKFDLVTDCKALLYLFTPRSRPCSRIERWVLRLQSFRYVVVHISGDQNAADAISRLSTLDPKPFDSSDELIFQQIASVNAAAFAVTWKEVVDASRQDGEISEIVSHLNNDNSDLLPLAFRIVSTELCSLEGVLLRGNRLVIPFVLRQRVLTAAHDGHPGERMMKAHLRSSVWWPKIDKNVENFVKSCRGCMLVSAPDAPEPLTRKTLPSGPWEDIAIDYLGPLPEGQHLLVAVDYYSRYVEVVEMECTDSANTIKQLLIMFSRFGIPTSIKADNGPQFASDEFKYFCEEYGIHLINTIPYWPQMNGQVERQNRSILKRMRIAQELGKPWRKELYDYLLVYHSTDHPTTGVAPSVLMFGRRVKSKLPGVPAYTGNDEEVRDTDALRKEKGKEYTNKIRRAGLSDIQVGDVVLAKRMKKDNKLQSDYSPEEYVVVRKAGSDVHIRSKDSGKELRRNVSHLKKLPKQPDVSLDVSGTSASVGTEGGSIEPFETVPDEESVHVEEPDNSVVQKRRRNEPVRFRDYVPH